ELPGPRGTLEVGRHGVEHQAGVLAHNLCGGEDELARDRIALLRHGRGRAATRHERLERLPDFGLHHEHHVGGDFGERTRDEPQERYGFRETVAGDMPWCGRAAEAELR